MDAAAKIAAEARARDGGPAPADGPKPFERGDDVELGRDLARRLGGRAGAVFDLGEVWRYADRVWRQEHEKDLERAAHAYAGRRVKATGRNGRATTRALKVGQGKVAGTVRVCQATLHMPGFFAAAPAGAAFVGDFARVDESARRVVVEPLGRDHRVRSTHVTPFALPPVDCPRPMVVDKLLTETWAGCDDIDQRIAYFYQWLGLALLGIATRYKDSPLLVGVKDTGKSQLLNVIASVFPEGSRRSVTLHMMAREYHRAHLAGGRINFVNELPGRDLLESEAAKAILSGDTVGCRQPAGRVFDWRPTCAHAFACNELPPTLDPALSGRFVVLDCPNVVPADRQDKRLPERIAAEAPLVARAAIRAAEGVLQRGYVERPASAAEASERWAMESDPVRAWAVETLRPSPEATIAATELYRRFQGWSDDNGHRSMSSTKWGKRMAALGYARVRSNGSRWCVETLSPFQVEAERRWAG